MKEWAGNILRVLDRAGGRAVTVFGDYCLDKYLYIDPVGTNPPWKPGLRPIILITIKECINQILPMSDGLNTLLVQHQGLYRTAKLIDNQGKGLEHRIAESLFADFIPDHFNWIQLGRIWQEGEHLYVFWHNERK